MKRKGFRCLMMEDEQNGEEVRCGDCEQDVLPIPNPKGKGPAKCPKCHVFIQTKKIKHQQQAGKDDGRFNFNMGTGTGLNSHEMQLVENLVNTGVGNSPADILKKGVYALASGYSIGGGNMVIEKTDKKEPVDASKIMNDLQAREATDITLASMREKIKTGASLDSKELMEMLKTRQTLKMLTDMDKDEGTDFGMKDMMQLQMLQSFAPQNQNNNGNQALVDQVKELQRQLSEQKNDARYQEILNKIESKVGQGDSANGDIKALKETMLEIEKIRDSGRVEVEKSKQTTQIEIEKRKELELTHKLAEIERKSQDIVASSKGPTGITKSSIAELKDTMAVAKELANELGGGEAKKGKDAGELVTDVINKTITNLTPIAKKYMEDKAAQPQQYQQPPVERVYTDPQQQPAASLGPVEPAPQQPLEPVSTEEEMAGMMHSQQSSNKKHQ